MFPASKITPTRPPPSKGEEHKLSLPWREGTKGGGVRLPSISFFFAFPWKSNLILKYFQSLFNHRFGKFRIFHVGIYFHYLDFRFDFFPQNFRKDTVFCRIMGVVAG